MPVNTKSGAASAARHSRLRWLPNIPKRLKSFKPIAAKAKIDLPTTMDSEHQEKIGKLKSLAADNLDKAHDAMQVATYQNAVHLSKSMQRKATTPPSNSSQ